MQGTTFHVTISRLEVGLASRADLISGRRCQSIEVAEDELRELLVVVVGSLIEGDKER
jgi:hypothetical protein